MMTREIYPPLFIFPNPEFVFWGMVYHGIPLLQIGTRAHAQMFLLDLHWDFFFSPLFPLSFPDET